MTVNIPLEYDSSVMTEEWLVDLFFKIWEINHMGQSAKKHFADEFQKAKLPSSDEHMRNLLSGRTRMGDVGWQVLVKQCGPIAAGQRKRWLRACERKAGQ